MHFFWRCISFFRYLFTIYNCFWIILLWIFWNLHNFISNCITNQITSCFSCFLNYSFWRSFKWICCRFFSMIKKFLLMFLAICLPLTAEGLEPTSWFINFYPYSGNYRVRIHSETGTWHDENIQFLPMFSVKDKKPFTKSLFQMFNL